MVVRPKLASDGELDSTVGESSCFGVVGGDRLIFSEPDRGHPTDGNALVDQTLRCRRRTALTQPLVSRSWTGVVGVSTDLELPRLVVDHHGRQRIDERQIGRVEGGAVVSEQVWRRQAELQRFGLIEWNERVIHELDVFHFEGVENGFHKIDDGVGLRVTR